MAPAERVAHHLEGLTMETCKYCGDELFSNDYEDCCRDCAGGLD